MCSIGVPEQALGWFPLGLGLVVEDEPSELFKYFHKINVYKTYCVTERGINLSSCDVLLLGDIHKELVLQEKEATYKIITCTS